MKSSPLLFLLLLPHLLNAQERHPKVTTFSQMLTQGHFAGRYRMNSFIYDAGSRGESHQTAGVGGSLLYTSADLKGFSFTSGLYFSQSLGDANLDTHRYGKDTFSSKALAEGNRRYMRTFAQNYLAYQNEYIELKLGDFLFKSFLLSPHDTKMIPNAFEGASLELKMSEESRLKLAYLTKQKLRDHEQFHAVLVYSKYDGNDDGAMHRGLTQEKLNAKGVNDRLLVAEVHLNPSSQSSFRVGYTAVPKLISSATLEGTYQFNLNKEMSIKPAIKYMHQFDNGAGAIGGASLRDNTIGYSNPNSLNSSLIASKVVFTAKPLTLHLGYSKVADKGDIVAPWHGLPTGGYSRTMSTTNWYANTQSFMLKADYTFPKERLFEGLKLIGCYSLNNFDDTKPALMADTNIATFDMIKTFQTYPNLELKLRSIVVSQDHEVQNRDGTIKKNPSYKALRLEMNYRF